MREIERAIEATKKYQKIEKREKEIKREKGAHYYSFWEIHTRTPSYILYSIEIIIYAYSYVGTFTL